MELRRMSHHVVLNEPVGSGTYEDFLPLKSCSLGMTWC
jgi:hypothetical protein